MKYWRRKKGIWALKLCRNADLNLTGIWLRYKLLCTSVFKVTTQRETILFSSLLSSTKLQDIKSNFNFILSLKFILRAFT